MILKMVYYPELSVWVSQEPFPNKEMEGRLPKVRLFVSRPTCFSGKTSCPKGSEPQEE
uniref:Neuronal regeneration-related protein n=1 Tax=Rousettus aegyptiacus TaxID=9407 RepID=A0A7J8F1P9_ROUAE|nr:neuronal regeneration related protein [Rousettus aegyptiacus]